MKPWPDGPEDFNQPTPQRRPFPWATAAVMLGYVAAVALMVSVGAQWIGGLGL